MADLNTTNYSFVKPEVGASEDTWGTKLNSNWDSVDAALKAVSVIADATAAKSPVLTLSGDVTGTATFTNLGSATLTATVADDSHNHIISNVDGLQTALDAKLDASHDITYTLSGDVSGTATSTNMGNVSMSVTVADDSHNHVISNVDGLQTALDAKAPLANPTMTGTVNAGDALQLGSWQIWDSGGTLYFKYGTNNVFKIDSSGNITAEANVTAYGTV